MARSRICATGCCTNSMIHNHVILDKLPDRTFREWYLRKTIENGWSRSVPVHQIENRLIVRKESRGAGPRACRTPPGYPVFRSIPATTRKKPAPGHRLPVLLLLKGQPGPGYRRFVGLQPWNLSGTSCSWTRFLTIPRMTSPVDPRSVLLLFATLTVALDQPDCSCYAARHHPE